MTQVPIPRQVSAGPMINMPTDGEAEGRRVRSLPRWVIGLASSPVVVVAVAGAIAFSIVAFRGLLFLGPTTKAEGNQLDAILRLRAGSPLYVDFFHEPFLVTPYPPLMYAVDAVIAAALRLDIFQTTVAARGVSLLAMAAALLVVYRLSRDLGAGGLAGAIAASLALTFPFMDGWAFTTRADGLAIMLSLLASAALVRAPGRLYVAVIFSVLAFFTKQTMVAFPVAAVIWLVLDGRRRDAGYFVAVWAGLVTAIMLTLHVLTNGLYELNTIVAHMNPTNGFDAAAAAFLQLSRQAWLPIALAIGWLITELRRGGRPSLIGWYWLASMAITLYTLRGRGAAENYFIEPGLLSCALAGPSIAAIWARLPRTVWPSIASATALSLAAVLWSLPNLKYWVSDNKGSDPAPGTLSEVAQSQRVLAEEPTMVVLAGKPLLASDPWTMSAMSSAGRYDLTEILGLIQAHSFDLIVIRGNARESRAINGQTKWPPAVLRAVSEHYVVQRTRGPYWLYVPDRPR
jgi:dolichyl-phosphate-mannose-protein mannosyltransferase